MKPLGRKAYGSIPHLPGSRIGPGDHHCAPGQAVIACLTRRDKHDQVIVQEKLDGSCVAAALLEDGQLLALGRAGHLAQSSPYVQHQLWADWVRRNEARFRKVLKPGERIVGEWLAQAHGTRYDLGAAMPPPGGNPLLAKPKAREPFVAFDLMTEDVRKPYREVVAQISRQFAMPKRLNTSFDDLPMSIEDALKALGQYGFYGALDPVEGAMWRVERCGKVDFLAKYVKPGKVDGCYLPKMSGGPEVWNWKPDTKQERSATP